MFCKQQKFTLHSSRGWKRKVRLPAESGGGEHPSPNYSLHLLIVSPRGREQGEEAGSLGTLRRALIPFIRAPPHDLI